MRVNLQAAGLWDVIHKGAGDYQDDRNALVTLVHAVPAEMQAGLAVKQWNTERLCREFDDISFKFVVC
jgi:hypothetical protein